MKTKSFLNSKLFPHRLVFCMVANWCNTHQQANKCNLRLHVQFHGVQFHFYESNAKFKTTKSIQYKLKNNDKCRQSYFNTHIFSKYNLYNSVSHRINVFTFIIQLFLQIETVQLTRIRRNGWEPEQTAYRTSISRCRAARHHSLLSLLNDLVYLNGRV